MSRFFFLVLLLAVLPVESSFGLDRWRVDYSASRLNFRGLQGGISFHGVFERWQAEVVFHPTDLEQSSARVTIDMTSARTNDPGRDALMHQEPWLDSARYPTATFHARGFSSLGSNRYQTEATLTIREISRPVAMPFTVEIDRAQASATGSLTIQRRDFNVGQGGWQGIVAQDIIIFFSILAQRVT